MPVIGRPLFFGLISLAFQGVTDGPDLCVGRTKKNPAIGQSVISLPRWPDKGFLRPGW